MSLVKCQQVAGQDGEANAQDYSIVMLARTTGALFGLPIMTVAWANGIGIGGAALGLPYFLSAVRECHSCRWSITYYIGVLFYWLHTHTKNSPCIEIRSLKLSCWG